jgi:hypothetical protein
MKGFARGGWNAIRAIPSTNAQGKRGNKETLDRQ